MKKIYRAIATVVIGFLLKGTSLCCAMEDEGTLDITKSHVTPPLLSQSHSSAMLLACLQNSCFTDVVKGSAVIWKGLRLTSWIPSKAGLLSKRALFCCAMDDQETSSRTSFSATVSSPFPPSFPSLLHFSETPLACFTSCSQNLYFIDVEQKSTIVREGLWLTAWIYDNANDLAEHQRKDLANHLKESYKLCQEYNHPAQEMFSFLINKLESSHEEIQTDIQSYLTTFLQGYEKSENLDAVEMILFFTYTINKPFLNTETEKVISLANQLIKANRKEVATQYLYYIGGGAILGDSENYQEYLRLAVKHNHEGAKALLSRIN